MAPHLTQTSPHLSLNSQSESSHGTQEIASYFKYRFPPGRPRKWTVPIGQVAAGRSGVPEGSPSWSAFGNVVPTLNRMCMCWICVVFPPPLMLWVSFWTFMIRAIEIRSHRRSSWIVLESHQPFDRVTHRVCKMFEKFISRSRACVCKAVERCWKHCDKR